MNILDPSSTIALDHEVLSEAVALVIFPFEAGHQANVVQKKDSKSDQGETIGNKLLGEAPSSGVYQRGRMHQGRILEEQTEGWVGLN